MFGREENRPLPQEPGVEVYLAHPTHSEIETEEGPQVSEETQSSLAPPANTMEIGEGTVAKLESISSSNPTVLCHLFQALLGVGRGS